MQSGMSTFEDERQVKLHQSVKQVPALPLTFQLLLDCESSPRQVCFPVGQYWCVELFPPPPQMQDYAVTLVELHDLLCPTLQPSLLCTKRPHFFPSLLIT